MECSFVVGQTVVCIDFFEPRKYLPNLPQKGEAYTVRGITAVDGKSAAIYLQEIINPPVLTYDAGMAECAFAHIHFRPAVDLLAEFLASASRQKPRQKTKENV